jgi:hypothetical protein
MHYEELMMDSAILLRFNIYRHLLHVQTKQFPINQLAEAMNLNYQQTVIELTLIDSEIKKIDEQHQSFMMRAGKINTDNLSVSLDDYRYYLLQQTVPFSFILYFLNDPEPTIEGYCGQYDVSRSTISRKILPLKNYLKQFGLRLTYTDMGITGDERLARIALFAILWLGTRGLEQPIDVDSEKLETVVAHYQKYFPLSQTYFGNAELRLFAAIILARLSKKQVAKYDARANFLLKNNPYYDFRFMEDFLGEDFTTRQAKGESGFIYLLAHITPFYTVAEDQCLLQTIEDFKQRKNPVYPLVKEFLEFSGKQFFTDQSVLDNPAILGNLLNITYSFYIFQKTIPNIYQLVTKPKMRDGQQQFVEAKIQEFFHTVTTNSDYSFVLTCREELQEAFKTAVLPYFDWTAHVSKLKVGIAIEHNDLFVRNLYQFLYDLRFVQAEPYDLSLREDYDLIISSSSLLQKQKPNLPVYLWEHNYEDADLVRLYQRLRGIYTEKNQISFER